MLQRIYEGIVGHGKKLVAVARFEALGLVVNDQALERDVNKVDEALAAFGLVAERSAGQEPEPLYLWPENLATYGLFAAVSTQWLTGPGGAIGLSYPGVEVVMRNWRIKRKDEQRVFSEIQAMERATLRGWSERRDE